MTGRAFLRDRSAMAGVAILLVLLVVALAAPFVAPYDPKSMFGIIELKNAAPSFAHPFGTDMYSRDVLSRMIHGARISLAVAFLSVLLATTVGTLYGAVAGYLGGAVDALLMRVVDALLAIPRVLLLVAVATLWNGVGVRGLVLILGLTGWFGVSRLVRTLVVSTREEEFIVAARSLGASNTRILARHVLPQVLSAVVVAATLGVGNVIVIEAGLSYLGIGVRSPTASWGSIFYDGMYEPVLGWRVALFAGGAIVMTVLAVNLVADGLRDAMSARQLPAR